MLTHNRAFTEHQLQLALTSGSWLEPILHRLLAARSMLRGTAREHVMEEVCRLGTLLFLAPIWRVLGANPVRTAAVSRGLLDVLLGRVVAWDELRPLLVWVLYFAAVETVDLAERSQFVFMLGVLARGVGVTEWGDVMGVVKSVLWVEAVFKGSEELVRDAVMEVVGQVVEEAEVGEMELALFRDPMWGL